MKYGKYLEEAMVPEWKDQYINYKKLKKLLKPLRPEDPDQDKVVEVVDLEVGLGQAKDSPTHSKGPSPTDKGSASPKGTDPSPHADSQHGDHSGSDHVEEHIRFAEDDKYELDTESKVETPRPHPKPDLVHVHVHTDDHKASTSGDMERLRSSSTASRTSTTPADHKTKSILVQNPMDPKLDQIFNVPVGFKVKGFRSTSDLSEIDGQERGGLAPFLGHVYGLVEDMVPEVLPCSVHEKTFASALEENIEKCVSFYIKQSLQFDRDERALRSKAKKVRNHVKGATSRKEVKRLIRELYRGIRLLKNFHSLNYIAIVKILKKHKKTSQWKELEDIMMEKISNPDYYPETSHLESLMRSVEELFQEFCKGEGKLEDLRSTSRPGLFHRYTFVAGLNLGIAFGIVFVAALILLLLALAIPDYWSEAFVGNKVMLPKLLVVFPVYRFMLCVLLHFTFWGVNLLIFERQKLSVCFITNSSSMTFLRWNRVLYLASWFLVALLMNFLVFFLMISFKLGNDSFSPFLIPFFLFMSMLVILCLPLRTVFHHSRFYFLNALWKTCTAPYYDVRFEHFLLGDQLVSLVLVVLDLYYTVVFFLSGSFVTGNVGFIRSYIFLGFGVVVAIIPFWFRLAQVARRFYFDTKNFTHLANSGKYFVALVAGLLGATRIFDPSLRDLWIFVATMSSLYGMYWDIFMDWSLLQFVTVDKKLTIKVSARCTWVHVVAAVINFALRFLWSSQFFLLKSTSSPGISLKRELKVTLYAILEIYRRCQWNIFRMENEHYNNCGQFRAVAKVPEDDLSRPHQE